jgi:hypothetical protein
VLEGIGSVPETSVVGVDEPVPEGGSVPPPSPQATRPNPASRTTAITDPTVLQRAFRTIPPDSICTMIVAYPTRCHSSDSPTPQHEEASPYQTTKHNGSTSLERHGEWSRDRSRGADLTHSP